MPKQLVSSVGLLSVTDPVNRGSSVSLWSEPSDPFGVVFQEDCGADSVGLGEGKELRIDAEEEEVSIGFAADDAGDKVELLGCQWVFVAAGCVMSRLVRQKVGTSEDASSASGQAIRGGSGGDCELEDIDGR
ncbi:hypothetical protein HPP92_008016 [Vanilla planifolia]|uniref:Uncharacterized protein n=1 Tax=Vanilla planifolia TaxID=51239 RepID=A0A835VB91_VANPL|nr:hypothetical protein HPP92_008016 [Vanilla planifolia]